MARDTGTGQNIQGTPAKDKIAPPNINKKKGPTGINAVYREITRQYMEAFYRALYDETYFAPMPDCGYEDSPYNNIPPANDNVSDDIYSMDPQNDADYEVPPDEYYDEMVNDYQQTVQDTQISDDFVSDPLDIDYDAYVQAAYAETDNPNIDVETYDRYDIFARLHFAVDDFYEKTHHTKLHEIKEHANDIATDILDNIEKYIEENPTFKGITRRYAKPNKLTPDCIAQILLSANIFGRFKLENNTYLLGMYQEEGPDVGIYKLLESEDDCLELYRLMFEFDPGLKKPEREEIKQKLLIDAPLKKENSNPKLIALNNGICF